MVKAPPQTDLARRITDELLAFVAKEATALEPEARPLLDELESIIVAGGKRIRPRFCYWGHLAAGGSDGPEILRVGGSLEILHTFAVIFDDVMDRSPLRRSRLTTFRVLAQLSASVPHRGDPQRFGASAAILAGLLGFVLADRLLLTSGFDAASIARSAERFDSMRTKAIGGQYLDLLAAYHGQADEATARRIGQLKSAGYTVCDPLVIGALCASDDLRIVGTLEAYGAPLGEAFQIRDDVLGCFGDPALTGKDRDGDLREGKQTVLLAKARAVADQRQLALLERVGDPDISPEEIERAREAIRDTGALHATNQLVDELTERAKAAIDVDIVGPDAAAALRDLADEVTQRSR